MINYRIYIYLLFINFIGSAFCFEEIPGQIAISENASIEKEQKVKDSSDKASESDFVEDKSKTKSKDLRSEKTSELSKESKNHYSKDSELNNQADSADLQELKNEVKELKELFKAQSVVPNKKKPEEKKAVLEKVYDKNFDIIKECSEKLKEPVNEFKEKSNFQQLYFSKDFEIAKSIITNLPKELAQDSPIIEETIEILNNIVDLVENVYESCQTSKDILNCIFYTVTQNGIVEEIEKFQHNQNLPKDQKQKLLERTWGNISNFSKGSTANNLISIILKTEDSAKLPSDFLFATFHNLFDFIKQYIPKHQNIEKEFSRKGKNLLNNLSNLAQLIIAKKDSNETPNIAKAHLENYAKYLQAILNIFQKSIIDTENILQELESYLARCEAILKDFNSLKKDDKILDYVKN